MEAAGQSTSKSIPSRGLRLKHKHHQGACQKCRLYQFPLAAVTNYHKLDQEKNHRNLCSHPSKVRSLKSVSVGRSQGVVMATLPAGENLFLASPTLGGRQHSLACGHIPSISAPPPFWMCHITLRLPLIRRYRILIRIQLDHPVYGPQLKIFNFATSAKPLPD